MLLQYEIRCDWDEAVPKVGPPGEELGDSPADLGGTAVAVPPKVPLNPSLLDLESESLLQERRLLIGNEGLSELSVYC